MLWILFLMVVISLVNSQMTVAQVASYYVEPQENYTMQKISAEGKNYWIIKIDGQETFLIDDSVQIVRDKKTIEKVLISYMKESIDLERKRDEIRQNIDAFNKSQYPAREECERTTGVDRIDCVDKESCIKACYAVPLCAAQIRLDLVYAILDWNNARKNVDAAIVRAKEKSQNLNTAQDYSEMSALIDDMVSKMRVMESQKLYTIPYCRNMSVAYDSANVAKSNADEIATLLGGMDKIVARADDIYNRTEERISYWENRSSLYEKTYVDLVNTYNELKTMYRNAGFTDENIVRALKEAENYSKEISSLREEGKYKVAIHKGGIYKATLINLKVRIKTLDEQHSRMVGRAKDVLANILKAKEKLNSNSSLSKLNEYEEEVKNVINGKVKSSDISKIQERLDEIDADVKNIVANAVLEDNVTQGSGSDSILKGLCSILKEIENILGFSIDFFKVCA